MPSLLPSTMRGALGGLALGLLVVSTAPAASDWLVLEDGSRVETDGEWEVRGATVVFTLPNGTLSSLQLDDVDLEASREATVAAKTPSPTSPESDPAAQAPKEPILVLTDADVSRAEPREAAAETPAEEGAPAGDTESEKKLEVGSWSQSYNAERGALEIAGSVTNLMDSIAVDVEVMVSVLDEEGGLLAKVPADLSRPGIPPQGSVDFVAAFPGLTRAAAVEFELSGRRILLQGAEDDSG